MLQAPRIVRWTLPALLLTLVVGGYLIVSASGLRSTPRAGDSSAGTPAKTTRHRKRVKHVTVRRGDTASAIAHRVHLGVIELLRLNPDVDPRLLHPGQKLKISP